jgi:glycosyltransferase involved in cell wall biosynthesis
LHKLSVVLLSYNQEAYIEAALTSLLQQDLDDLEIVISDDASSDGTVQIINKTLDNFKTEKKIKLNVNPKNIGIVANLNHALSLTSGEMIFIAGGDDISINTRCSDCYKFWLSFGAKHDLVATDGYDMTQDGINLGIKTTDNLEKWTLEKWHKDCRPYFFGASHMISKRLINLNPLDTRLSFEDQTYVHRALMMGGAIRLPIPLVYHRRGGVSQPERHMLIGSKKQRLLWSANANLIELNQFILDASKLNMDNSVRELTDSKYALEIYTKNMLESRRIFEKINIFIKSRNINFSKRIRLLKYGLFYH